MSPSTSLQFPRRQEVFYTFDGQSMSASYVHVMLKRLAFKAGVEKRVHAHGFRHTHAAQLRAEGVNIGIIFKRLGHMNITTTATYLDHIASTAVVTAIQNLNWTLGCFMLLGCCFPGTKPSS